MMRPSLRRVLRMSAREIADRSSMTVRQQVDRWSWNLQRPRWRRTRLAAELDPSVPAIRRAAQLLSDGDEASAHRVLSAHFAWRPPRFVLSPTPARRLRASSAHAFRRPGPMPAAVPTARSTGRSTSSATRTSVSDLANRTNRSTGSAIRSTASARRWRTGAVFRYLDPALGDHKVIWELNRHQHWLALGRAYWLTRDPRYRAGFIAQLGSWMAANPPRTGINWASMLELGMRSLSWIWALHMFVEGSEDGQTGHVEREDERAWTVDLLLGLHAQLSLVEHHLSTYFSPNTHLLGEALALVRCRPIASRTARLGTMGPHRA